MGALLCAITTPVAAQTALPHNIPDFSQDPSRPTIRSAQSGNWSSASTWQGGQLPTANHVVIVQPGHLVTVDSTGAAGYTVSVHGTLRFNPVVDTRLTVTNLMVMGDHGMPEMTTVGYLEVGTAVQPIAAGRKAEIVIANSPVGGGVSDPEQFGTGIINFGKFTMHGAAMSPTFVRLATEPRVGDTTLSLSEPASGWRPGDRLVIPDTRHIKQSETTGNWINTQNQWEELTIQAVAADGRSVTLTAPLQFDHLGARDLNNVLNFLPHVGNLTRNVVIRSESATGTRGHVISVHTADTDVRYALLRDLGRTKYTPLNTTTNVIGRYPMHMHHNRGPLPTPANGYQFTLVGNAVDGGSATTQFKWGIAVHNSHYGLIQDNIVYNYNGSSIVTEDGSESFNVFDHNFALRGFGEPNNAVSEARNAMGTEGVGFWFRGPNNYVRNNVASNFQNATTEAAYGFVYQFLRLGNIATPNFKGADPGTAGQFTTRNGNNMPILQFDNNEAYGAMQGGFTYWWVSSQDPQPYANAQESLIKNLKIWHVYNKAVYHYPSQKITFDGLIIRGKFDALAQCCGNGVYGADYSTKGVIIRNSDIQGMEEGIQFPEAGFGPEPNLTVENSYLRNHSNIQVPTNGSVNGCWMENKLVVITNTRFDAPPGRSLNNIAMVRDVGYAPECLSKLDEARVYAYNGVATDNFQIYHTSASVLPRPPSSCSPTTRTGITGLLCPIAALGPVPPTVTLSASPTSVTSGQAAVLTWNTSNATTVTINQGIGTVATSGTRSVSPTATTTYTVTATNSVGSVSATATVTLTAATLPTVTLSASPTSISSGAAATLSWTTNATSVSINQSIGTVATSGTRSVSPTVTTTYTLTATNTSGSVTATATVTVTAPPAPLPTVTLSASPLTIQSGQPTTLTWSTTGATTVTINQGVGTVALSGATSVSPAATTTYTITAINGAGSVTAAATVTVSVPPGIEPFGTIGLTAGWATFGQVVPQGIAIDGLVVGTLPTQTDVKNRWPDGSIRFAIVTVNVPSNGSYPIAPTAASSGGFTPAAVNASVSLQIGSTAYTATLPATASTDVWLAGPLVREDRRVVTPVSTAGAAHSFLRVNFDRRVFNDGQSRMDVSVENMLDRTSAVTVTYDVVVMVNGQAVFTKAAVQHYYLTRWRKVFETGPAVPSEVTPDLTPFNESRALPPYLPLVTNVVSAPTGAAYDILKPGALIANMPDHGGRPELAPYPDWTARYLVYKNQTQRSFVLANGDLSGSWPIHVRERAGSVNTGIGSERYVSLDQRPNIWYDLRAQGAGFDYVRGTPLPMREYQSTIPGPGQSPLIPDNAHQPSLAYVPYLLTGDRYYAEEMAFWANYSMLRTYNGDGVRSSQGILQSNEVRGFGWALRNMVDAAAYYPDASPMKAYLRAKVTNNLTWLDGYANSQDPATNPFTVLWLDKRPEGPEYRGLWEENYLAYAIDRARQQGFTGGLAHRDAIAKFQVRLFNSEPAYPRSAAAPYVVGVGTPSGSGYIFHQTMSAIWNATQSQTRPFAGYHGPEARLNLMIGIDNGWPGAQDAYDYLWPFIGVQPAWGTVPDLGQRAGWAIDFSPGATPPPSPPPVVAAALVNPAPGAVFTSTSQTFTWSAGTGVSAYRLDVGTTAGGTNLAAGVSTSSLSTVVTGLPSNGSTVWVRLSSSINAVWQSFDYAFTAATIAPPSGGITARSVVSINGTGAVTAPSFSAAAGEILVAFAAAGGPSSGGQSLTISGAGLTWTRAVRANLQAGTSEIWWAKALTSLSAALVTSTPALAGHNQTLTVIAYAGATGIGNKVQANAQGTAPRIVLTTTRAGSLVYAIGNDWDRAIARTLGAGQLMVHEWVDTSATDTFWIQTLSGSVPNAGTTVTLNAIAPTLDRWNLAAIEIVK